MTMTWLRKYMIGMAQPGLCSPGQCTKAAIVSILLFPSPGMEPHLLLGDVGIFATPPRRRSPCGNGLSFLRSSIRTDTYPHESYLEVTVNSTGEVLYNAWLADYPDAIQVKESCLRRDVCHRIVIGDTFGDGISSPGRYDVCVDGKEIEAG